MRRSPSISSRKLKERVDLVPGFNAPVRHDRSDGYGGVYLATKSDLIDSEIILNTDCDIVATKVELYQQQPLVIISAYHPTNNDLQYAEKLCEAIRDIASRFPTTTLWVSGDFNLPDIDWSGEAITDHRYQSCAPSMNASYQLSVTLA